MQKLKLLSETSNNSNERFSKELILDLSTVCSKGSSLTRMDTDSVSKNWKWFVDYTKFIIFKIEIIITVYYI